MKNWFWKQQMASRSQWSSTQSIDFFFISDEIDFKWEICEKKDEQNKRRLCTFYEKNWYFWNWWKKKPTQSFINWVKILKRKRREILDLKKWHLKHKQANNWYSIQLILGWHNFSWFCVSVTSCAFWNANLKGFEVHVCFFIELLQYTLVIKLGRISFNLYMVTHGCLCYFKRENKRNFFAFDMEKKNKIKKKRKK